MLRKRPTQLFPQKGMLQPLIILEQKSVPRKQIPLISEHNGRYRRFR